MSEVIWKKTLIPDLNLVPVDKSYEIYGQDFKIPSFFFPENDQDLVTLPDRRAYRSMGRSSVLMSSVALEAKEKLKTVQENKKFSVGLYAAIDNGPDDYQCVRLCLDAPEKDFVETYRKNRSPKQYLKQLPNLAPAQLGIFLDIRGPMNVYIHSKLGPIHALEQAEFDLNNGIVDMALVCASFSLEDPLLVERTHKDVNYEKTLSEGAAAMILVKNNEVLNWSSLAEENKRVHEKVYFGIADQLINFCLKE